MKSSLNKYASSFKSVAQDKLRPGVQALISRQQYGFTLIEVLAALIIVSLGMLAVIQAVSQTVNNASYMRDKTIAHWVAMNQLTEVRLAPSAPPGGDTAGDVEMAGTTWHWRMTVKPTDAQTMRRIDVKVGPKADGDNASIASVSGFYGTAVVLGSPPNWDATPNQLGGSSSSSSSSSSASFSSVSSFGGTP